MIVCIARFFKEVQEESLAFLRFCREEKTLRWFTAFAILVFWGIKIVYNDVYIDSEVMSIEPNGLIQSWYGHKRYGLILMKKLFFYVRLVPYLSNLLFAAVLWGVILLLCFSVKRWFALALSGGSKWSLYLLAALFVSCPSLAEQYMFTLQAFEITLAMGFCLIAAYSADQAICEGKSFLWYAPALFFLVWSLGAYQSFCPFYIALVLLSFLGSYERGRNQRPFRAGILHLALFLLGFVSNTLVGNALCLLKGGDSSYVDGMYLWGKIPLYQSLQDLWYEFRILYCGMSPVLYNRFAGIVLLLSAAGLAVRGVLKKWNWRQILWYWLALLLLAASPMYISLISGTRTTVRAQLVFPLVFGFFSAALWYMVRSLAVLVWQKKKTACRLFCAVLTAGFFYLSWAQGIHLIQLNQTVHDTCTRDMLTAERMYMDICRAADREDMQNQKVVFIGSRDAKMPQAAALGESIGRSFFDFGTTSIGISNRAVSFFNYLGMNMGLPTPEDYAAALEASQTRPCWPANDSVFSWNDCIVVKLSN